MFVAFPALKAGLLNVTRASLLMLPFIWRWKLWRKYRRLSMLLLNIPIFALCIVFAMGLDQCPRTHRWRMLLMTEHEEMAWARRKFEEYVQHDGPLLLKADDPRVERVARVTTRLVTALEQQEQHMIHGASWPPRHHTGEVNRVQEEQEKSRRHGFEPSATAASSFLPFKPGTSNPLKVLEGGDWNVWVVDQPKINAFALPSKDIFVYSGLVDLVDDDTLLSAVLAHEIAHVTQRHAVENLGFLNVASVAFDVLRGVSFALTISFPFITDSAAMFINWLNNIVAERAFSRKLEMEADAVGLDFMALAGSAPQAAFDLWDLMSAVEADAEQHGSPSSFTDKFSLLQTHPPSQVRQDAIKKLLPRALELYRGSTLGKIPPTPGAEVTAKSKAMAMEHDLVGGRKSKDREVRLDEQSPESTSKDSKVVSTEASSENKVAVAA